MLAATSGFDPDVWSGRAVQEVFVDPADAVLHQCIRPLFGAVVLRVIMDISAYAISLADRPRADQNGSPVFAYAGNILSQTLAGRSCRLRHQWLLLLCCSFVYAEDRCFVPACARRKDHAGQDAIASVLMHAKARPLLSTAHAMRASLLASAMASTLWCSRFFAASIQDLSP